MSPPPAVPPSLARVPAEVRRHLTRLETDARVVLWRLDMTRLRSVDGIPGRVERFTSTPTEVPLVFGNEPYPFVPVEVDGYEWNGQGRLPTPSLRVSSVGTVFKQLVVQFRNLVGAELTRIRTWARYLDDGPFPDPEHHLVPDVYTIERKVEQGRDYILWELASPLDNHGRQVPRRRVWRDTCTHTYRTFDPATGDFSYAKVTCPYTDDRKYTVDGETTAFPERDDCGRRVSDCKLRFGNGGALPYRGFPGVARLR